MTPIPWGRDEGGDRGGVGEERVRKRKRGWGWEEGRGRRKRGGDGEEEEEEEEGDFTCRVLPQVIRELVVLSP